VELPLKHLFKQVSLLMLLFNRHNRQCRPFYLLVRVFVVAVCLDQSAGKWPVFDL